MTTSKHTQAFLIALCNLLIAAEAFALEGPMDTLPGSTTFTWDGQQTLGPCEDGNMARDNTDYQWVNGDDGIHAPGTLGKTMYIGPVSIARDARVYWGPTDANAVQLSLQAGPFQPYETLAFNTSQSSLGTGMMRFTGTTYIYIWTGSAWSPHLHNTRWTMTVTNLSSGGPAGLTPALSIGLPGGIGAVLKLEEATTYKVHTLFEVEVATGSWEPAYNFYNRSETPSGSGGAQYTFNHSFWYEPLEIAAVEVNRDSLDNLVITWSGLLTGAGYTVYSTTNLLDNWMSGMSFYATSTVSQTIHSMTPENKKFFRLRSLY